MVKLNKLIKFSKDCGSQPLVFIFRYFYFKIQGKQLIADNRVIINNLRNLTTNAEVKIGIDNTGFATKHDRTFLNLNGKLIFEGNFTIGKGCRFDISENGIVQVGKNGYIIGFSDFIISHGLKIGDNCAISWGCQFLDNDFHEFDYEGRKTTTNNEIVIGDNVWIGCKVSVYKGVKIANGCVIAANSVIKSSFTDENVLIAGNPAKIIKQNISWK